MPGVLDATSIASLVLAGLVGLASAFLGWRQWRDHLARPVDLSEPDERYFARQDLRRTLGTIVLALVAVGLVLGAMMPARINGRANLKFVQLWSGIIILIGVLPILAFMDVLATRFYARRHRQTLTRQGLSILEAEMRYRFGHRTATDSVGDDSDEDDRPVTSSG